jgi:hypothetical protein
MSAADVIDQIKALPPPEHAKVVTFVQELEAAEPPVRTIEPRAFEQAMERVFDRHDELMRKLSQ